MLQASFSPRSEPLIATGVSSCHQMVGEAMAQVLTVEHHSIKSAGMYQNKIGHPNPVPRHCHQARHRQTTPSNPTPLPKSQGRPTTKTHFAATARRARHLRWHRLSYCSHWPWASRIRPDVDQVETRGQAHQQAGGCWVSRYWCYGSLKPVPSQDGRAEEREDLRGQA